MRRKGLMNRVLAGILCTTLVFQNVSVTSYATESNVEAEMTTEENVEELSDELEASEKSESYEQSTDALAVSEDSSAPEGVSEDATESVENTTAQADETEQVSETIVSESTADAVVTEETEESAETTVENDTNAEIVINEEVISTVSKFDIVDEKVVVSFQKVKDNPLNEQLDRIKNTSDAIDVKMTDGSKSELEQHLVYEWQARNEDGTYTKMTEAPVNVGEYKLVISLDESVAKADAKEIIFVIKKSQMKIVVPGFNAQKKSGITVQEIIDEITEKAEFKEWTDEEGKINSYDRPTYIRSFTVTVRESASTEALTADYVLKKGGDYTVDILAELNEAYVANYEIMACDAINLRVDELKETKLTVTTQTVENEQKGIIRIYTGEPIAEPSVEDSETAKAELSYEITVVDEIDEATGEEKVLTVDYANLTKVWFDSEGNKLESEPTDAGTYYFQLKYADEEGIYAESESELIKVVVEPVKLTLKPALEVVEYYVGMSPVDVTSGVTYTLVREDGSEFDFDAETFWGVSYNRPDKAQSYEPLFKLEKCTVTKDEKGNESTVWTDVNDSFDVATGTIVNTDKNFEVTTSYRLVFTGKKALYDDAKATNPVDVNGTGANSSNQNYLIDVTDASIEANAIAITVKDSANATIDVEAMLPAELRAVEINKDDKVYTKIYDGVALYENRKDYKKAVVKAVMDGEAEGEVIASDTDDDLAYKWYTYELETRYDEAGNEYYKPVINYEEIYSLYNELPVDAGNYVLEVTYTDNEHKYFAKPAHIYFEIEQQLIKVVLEGTPVAYIDDSISSLTSKVNDDINYTTYLVPGNDTALTNDQLTKIDELSKVLMTEDTVEGANLYTEDYTVDWYVAQGDNIDADKAEYEEIGNESGTYFRENVLYRLGAKIEFENIYGYNYEPYFGNYTQNYDVVVEGETQTLINCDTVPITLKEKGNVELDIRIDASKLTATQKEYDGKPFDISEDIKDGLITVYKKNTDEKVPFLEGEEGAIDLKYVWYYTYDMYNNGQYVQNGKQGYLVNQYPVDAYTYVLKVSYAGDETYAAHGQVEVGTFTINTKELTVTIAPDALAETIVAGTDMNDALNRKNILDASKVEVTGYIPEDTEAFTKTETVYDIPALCSLDTLITDRYGNASDRYLRTGREYAASYRSNERYIWTGYYDRGIYREGYKSYPNDNTITLNPSALYNGNPDNYTVKVNAIGFETNKRGNSDVEEEGITRLIDTYNEYDATITALDGIPYMHNSFTDVDKDIINEDGGNYFIFKIEKPDEFKSDSSYKITEDAVYKNSIEAAGGYVLRCDSNYIYVAFDANACVAGEATGKFDIIWEEETSDKERFTETFTVDFSQAELEADLTTAVTPKSLKFNSYDKKMIVGEGQQLDVVITKNLIDDVICLDYEVVSGEDVVSINSLGYVTALKKGTATVGVFPVKYDIKGNKIRLDFKPVTAKLTVADVSAPKLSKLTAYDYQVKLEYAPLKDGYRREIYIVETKGRKLKPADFETEIAAMNQNQFGGIRKLVTPGEEEESRNRYNSKNNVYLVDGLNPNTDYTVYVRNVSGIRTLSDDSFVVSSATGSVKKFKTTKVQIDDIDAIFDETQPVTWDYEELLYQVPLTAKQIQFTAYGNYAYKPEEVAADDDDYISYKLPLDKQQQQTYVNPKLTYRAYSVYYDSEYERWVTDYDNYSNIVKIDKKGKIKLLGDGRVKICAYDSISEEEYYLCTLDIVSQISKITAKNTTLKVAEPIDIHDKLTFFEGRTKLKFDQMVPAVKVEVVSGEGVKVLDDGIYEPQIVATKSNQKAELKIYLEGAPEIFTTMKVTTKKMSDIKKLKTTDVLDDSFDLTFIHSVYKYDNNFIRNNFDYKIVLKDGRGDVIFSRLVEMSNMLNTAADYKKRQFSYKYEIDENITRLSNYTISVTPMFFGEKGKTVTTKVKTIDIPAYNDSLLEKNELGGMPIACGISRAWIEEVYLTSGKLYTFVADVDLAPDGRFTDVLTWKSSNTKVATIKANSDSSMATFKALKSGMTIIEVSSKLRKGVVARYIVKVKAVGSPKADDTEQGDFDVYDLDKDYVYNVEVLTEANPVTVTKQYYDEYRMKYYDLYDWDFYTYEYDYKWVKFEAPADGSYTFRVNSDYSYNRYYSVKDAEFKNITWKSDGNGSPIQLSQGEIVYFKVYGSFEMSVTGNHYARLTTASVVNSKDASVITFTAPEDNYYTFSASKPGPRADYVITREGKVIDSNLLNFANENNKTNGGLSLSKGDVVKFSLHNGFGDYNVSVSRRIPVSIEVEKDIDTGALRIDDEKWFAFTADVAGTYTFTSTGANANVEAEWYSTLKQKNKDNNNSFTDVVADTTGLTDQAAIDKAIADAANNFTGTVKLDKDETVYIKVYTTHNTDAENAEIKEVSAKFKVTRPKFDTVTLGTEKMVTFDKNGEAWLTFEVPADYVKYTFSVTDDHTNENYYNVSTAHYKNSVTGSYVSPITNTLKKGDKVHIKLTVSGLANGKTANVKVLISEPQAPTEIKVDEPKTLTIENGGEYFYTFKASTYGLYVFESKVTANTDKGTHSIRAYEYSDVNDPNVNETYGSKGNDFYKEAKLVTGKEVVFAVKPTNTVTYTGTDGKETAVTTAATIVVKQVKPTDLPNAEMTIAKNSEGTATWYKYVIPADDTYTITADGAANVYYSATLDADMNVNANGVKQAFAKGESLFFKVVSTNNTDEDKKLTLTVKGTKSLVEDIPAAAFEMSANETRIYKYTVTEPGRYVYNVTSKTDGVTATVTRSQEYDGEYGVDQYNELKCTTVGKTYYFKVTTDVAADKKASVELSVKPITVTAMTMTDKTGTATATFDKVAGRQWYSYTVQDTGRYTFASTRTVDEVTSDYDNVSYYIDNFTSANALGISGVNEHWFTKGDVIYIAANNNYTLNTVNISLKVASVAATAIEADKETSVSLKGGETVWYKFTADTDNYYTFITDWSDSMLVDCDIYLTGEDASTGIGEGKTSEYYNAGTELLIRVKRTDAGTEAATAKLTVKKETMLELKEGTDLTITAKSGELQYIKFIAPRSSKYAITIKEADNETYVYLDDSNAKYRISEYEVGKQYSYKVYASFTGETENSTKTFKLSVEEIVPTKLLAETDAAVSVVPYQRVWFTFEAPETAVYRFTNDSTAVDVKCLRSINAGSGWDMPYEIDMHKGDVVNLGVYYSSAKDGARIPANASFKIKMSKVAPITMAADGITVVSDPMMVEWYSYTAAKNGEYTFIEDKAVIVNIYDRMIGGIRYNGRTISLDAGETVYLRAYTNAITSNAASRIIVETTEVNTYGEIDKPYTIEFTQEDITNNVTAKWVAFKVPETGLYYLDKSSVNVAVDIYYNNSNSDIAQFAVKDSNIYVKAVRTGSSAASAVITMTPQRIIAPKEIKLCETQYVNLLAGQSQWFEFTAPDSGTYIIYSTSVAESEYTDTKVEINNRNMIYKKSDNNSGEDNNFKCSVYLDAGETVYCETRGVSGDYNIKYNVTIERLK